MWGGAPAAYRGGQEDGRGSYDARDQGRGELESKFGGELKVDEGVCKAKKKKRCPADGAAGEARKLGDDLEVEAFYKLKAASRFDGKPKRGIGCLGQRMEVLGACLVTRMYFRPFCINV